jgi:hypothetical protein
MKHPPWITLAVIAYGIMMSKDLVTAWTYSPLDHYSFIPFLIWLWPAKRWTCSLGSDQAKGLSIAIALIFIGILASLNMAKYAGLAIAIASLMPWTYHSFIWTALAICWMPGFIWLAIHWLPTAHEGFILAIRCLLAFAGVGVMHLRGRHE